MRIEEERGGKVVVVLSWGGFGLVGRDARRASLVVVAAASPLPLAWK